MHQTSIYFKKLRTCWCMPKPWNPGEQSKVPVPGSIVEVDLEDGDLLTMEAQADFGESQGSKACGIFWDILRWG